MPYSRTNSKGVIYYLHRTTVTLRRGESQDIYFFAKKGRNEKGEPADLPEDRIVKENPRNGFLTISKYRDREVKDEDGAEESEDEVQEATDASDSAPPPLAAPLPPIASLIRRFGEEAARIVATNPAALEDLEWRDLERMMATVLDGLGFKAELTPASKDGGKDIILEIATDSGSDTYIVELKHWRSGKRVGDSAVHEFVKVVANECRTGGLFLATQGFTADAFQTLTEIQKTTVKFGSKTKVVSLCRSYLQIGDDLWQPADEDGLRDILLSDTLEV